MVIKSRGVALARARMPLCLFGLRVRRASWTHELTARVDACPPENISNIKLHPGKGGVRRHVTKRNIKIERFCPMIPYSRQL